MPLSIVIPLDGVDASGATEEEDEEVSYVQLSSHSPSPDVPCLSGTLPVTTSSTHRVSSRKPSSRSLAIFNRPAPLTPPVIHWVAPPDSPGSSSSSTLVESPQEERERANAIVCRRLRSHLQTCLDENKLANRGLTMDNTVSYCAALKGFQVDSGLPLDGSFQQLLMHATMLDFALEESNHEGLAHILQGLDRGVDEFLDSLDKLPFDLRNTQSLISSTSDILETKSALLGVASHPSRRADGRISKRIVKRCHHERDMLLRSIRVLLDIVDFESKLQAKLSIQASESSIPTTPSPKKRIRFRRPTLSLRQSNTTQRSKPRDAPPVPSPSQPETEEKDEEDEYSYYAAMAADVVSLEEAEEYWGVRMPAPVGDAADFFLSDESGSMQGASLAALVYILTDPHPHSRTPGSDPDLLDTFLLCFRSFCDPIEVAKALIARYEERPRALNRSQREAWPHYHSSVKARVLRLISTWIDQYWIHERDRIAGLHIKEFVSLIDEEFLPNNRAEITRKLRGRCEEAIALARTGNSVDESQPADGSSSRAACRQRPIQYKGRLRARAEKIIRKVSHPAPTADELERAKALDDFVGNSDNTIHVLDLNSREFCQELARQLAIFMSEGYLRVIPEDLWYRFSMGHGSDADTARSTQQTYESALALWVAGAVLDQVEAEPRAAVMTFFIALALRSHEYHNYSAMRSIYAGLLHPSLETLTELRLPLSDAASWALDRLGELKENMDVIALDGRGVGLFPQPTVPAMDWYLNEITNAINAKSLVVSPDSHVPVANMDRCYNVVRIIHEMEHWHVPYNYPRGDNVQAWLLKSLEGAISRDSDKECDWMFKQSSTIEQTGRPESTKQKLPRLSNPFGKKNKPEWKVATLWDLFPELEPDTQPYSDGVALMSRYSKPLPPLPIY